MKVPIGKGTRKVKMYIASKKNWINEQFARQNLNLKLLLINLSYKEERYEQFPKLNY